MNSIKTSYHILFWIFFYIIQLFADLSNLYDKEVLYFELWSNAIFTLLVMPLVYLNVLYLIPKHFLNKKYFLYFSINLVAFIAINFVYVFIESQWMDGFMFSGFSPGIEYEYFLFSLVEFVLVVGAILFIWIAFQQIQMREKMNAIEKESREAQLKLLRSQVQPHFLFNALNNINFLITSQPDKASDLLLKLSDLLRCQLYETDNEWVTVQEEIKNLENYIALEKVRLPENVPLKVDFDVNNATMKIPPFLLLPLVENAFKHSVHAQGRSVEFYLESHENSLTFISKNTIGTDGKKVGGLGLENLKNRLEMLFPENYTFDIDQKDNIFTVELKLNA